MYQGLIFSGKRPFHPLQKAPVGTERGRGGWGAPGAPSNSEPLPLFLSLLATPPGSGRQPPRIGVASLLAMETPLPVGHLLLMENDRLPLPWSHPLSPSQGRPVWCPLHFPATALLYLGGFRSPLICSSGRLCFAFLFFSPEQFSEPFLASFRCVCFPLNQTSIALPSKSKGKPLLTGPAPLVPRAGPSLGSGCFTVSSPLGTPFSFPCPTCSCGSS